MTLKPDDLGCTADQFAILRGTGEKMLAAGKSPRSCPIDAFYAQRKSAKHRGIGWEMTIWEWWSIWHDSGHWNQRGIGAGYMMCRKGDEGPYAVGNVFIATGIVNHATMRSTGDLPRGVKPSGKQFVARRKGVHLGRYPTPELAHEAFLRAAGAA